jgi:acyl-CoA synthetase (AMP-forming)/AMP-acid ligase II
VRTLQLAIHRSPLPAPATEPLPALVLRHAQRDPAARAVIDGLTGEALTRGELAERSGAFASALRARGVGEGDLVALLMPNLAWWPVVALGVWRAGAALVPLSPLWTARDCARALERARPRLAIAFGPLAATLREALQSAAADVELLVAGPAQEGAPLAELLADPPADGPAEPAPDPGRLAVVPFSSGTSGLPKGVRLTHANLAAGAAHGIDALSIGRALDEHAVMLACAPFFHALGLALTLAAPLAAGARVVTLPRPELEALLALVERERVTHLVVPPPLVAALARDPRVDAHDLSSLAMVATGGAHVPARMQLAAGERLGCVVRQGYGITEATCTVAAPLHRPSTAETCGWLMAGTEARLVDPASGADAPAGEPGELLVRGPQVMQGYHADPEATAATLTADGWLRTGDLVRFTEAGELEVRGRLKELIKVHGQSVAPAEIELVLCEHPAVRDAGVVGMPDPETGEAPVALVAADGSVGARELAAFAGERLATYKRPREVRIVDRLPRLPTGKLIRSALRELAAARREAP